jgi:hypothetical protein
MGADEPGYSNLYWIKLNVSNFVLESIKELKMPEKVAGVGPAFQFIAGRFLVTNTGKHAMFIDIESGEVVQTVKY